jgi:hypothetical protein
MIGFISSWFTHSPLIILTHRQYSANADIHTFQFTVAHALGFSFHWPSPSNGFRHKLPQSHTSNITHKSDLLFTCKIFTGRRTVLFVYSLHFTYNSHSQPRTLNSLTQLKSITSNHTSRYSPTTNLPRLSPIENYS